MLCSCFSSGSLHVLDVTSQAHLPTSTPKASQRDKVNASQSPEIKEEASSELPSNEMDTEPATVDTAQEPSSSEDNKHVESSNQGKYDDDLMSADMAARESKTIESSPQQSGETIEDEKVKTEDESNGMDLDTGISQEVSGQSIHMS